MNFFGTDGVRGTANIENLSPESALRLAQFATKELITFYLKKIKLTGLS